MDPQDLSEARIQGLIDDMLNRRDNLLNEYLMALEKPEWTNEVSMLAVNTAGRLSDCDRHITNLQLELKRLKTTGPKKEVAHA